MAIVALCVGAVLAACASITSNIAFQPPVGWTGTPAMFGHFQMWMKSGRQKDTTQILMLIKGNPQNTHADFNALPPQYGGTDVKVLHRGSIKMCGTQPAEQFVAQGTDKNGKRAQIEMTSTLIGQDRYIAMYIRPLAVTADQQAETAIRSLCPSH
jgi:hypothetical protein